MIGRVVQHREMSWGLAQVVQHCRTFDRGLLRKYLHVALVTREVGATLGAAVGTSRGRCCER